MAGRLWTITSNWLKDLRLGAEFSAVELLLLDDNVVINVWMCHHVVNIITK